MGSTTETASCADPIELLSEARDRTLAIVGGLATADLDRVLDPVMSPIAWDLGHIAAFEDLWLVHHPTGSDLLRDDLSSTYDAIASPRSERPNLPWLRADGAFEFLSQVRQRTVEVLNGPTPPSDELVELVVRHEHQHAETILQTVQLARVGWQPSLAQPTLPEPAPADCATNGVDLIGFDGGHFELGADADGFAYDNERPRHQVELEPFLLARSPALNGDWLEFIASGGYSRAELWSADGRAWLERSAVTAPGGWFTDGNSEEFLEWRAGTATVLDPLRPVVHINVWEAEAFAQFHGMRLPTEVEWEFAALSCRSHEAANLDTLARGTRRIYNGAEGPLAMLGDVWEWTSSDFNPYPGFTWHPYREYSQPHFGPEHRVLRGGSWATRQRVATPHFRNWDLPERRQIFAGVRLACDA
jgi:iron(II)-dependent oxidoreductase